MAAAPAGPPVGEVPSWTRPLGALVGSGGFASVWAIADGGVLKVAHADHALARARLAREAEALDAIGGPAVPQLEGRGRLADGRAWIAMERIAGQSITELTTAGPMGADRAVSITLAILDALERVHAAGFVHRDLKPDNLVRREDGSVVVLDLGLARKLPVDPDDPTRANVQVGSLEYVSPEQLVDAASVDVRADLYAVGCVLFELCAGRPPFIGDAAALERAHAALRPPRLSAMASVPLALDGICQDCLAKDPSKRPRSAADLRARLLATRDTPSIMRSVPAISQIAESKQPVVLVWAELPKVDRALLGLFAARHVVVVSQRGRRVLGALLGSVHGDPATMAVALARELAAAGARVAIHLDALRIETVAGATRLHGEAAEQPEAWLPTSAWTGVILTRAIASVAQAPTRPADSAGPGFRLLAEASDARELFGRDAILTDLVADADVALRGGKGPAIAVVIGDAGVGKTVVAAELARRIVELGVRVHVATVPAPGSGKPSPLVELIGTPDGPAVRAIGDAVRAAARAQPTAIILDDLHLADHELLDALEYATLGGEALPLWVLGVGSPRLDVRRPSFGAGAERRRHDMLPALDEEAAVSMTAALLQPAEYPPLRALRQLVTIARGSPLHLTMLAREVHERGAIRRRSTGEFFLDTSILNELEPIALGPWLAARELAGLTPELVALARIAAVIGGAITRDALAAIVEAVERAGGPTSLIDVDVGLRELTLAGVLESDARGHRFRHALVEEGIYATTDEAVRRVIHEAALQHWSVAETGELDVAERIARHAEAVAARPAAAAAYARLGEVAEHEHRALDADLAWSGALRNLEARDTLRARALLGLARARCRVQRLHEALSSLEEATQIASEVGDLELEVETLLEQGTVLDFCEDFARSKEVSQRARARLATAPAPDPGLAIKLELADVRALFREQRFPECVALGRTVLAAARSRHHHETATIAALLLGCALADVRELDEAERVFAEMIESCELRGDRFHLAAAFGNRAWLWSARGQIDRTATDLRLASQLARESGQAHFERVATHNLAEHLLWEHQLDEALPLARRGLALQRRAGEGSTRTDRLLLARILAARGDTAELATVLATFANETELGQDEIAVLGVLTSITEREDAARWESALTHTEAVFLQLRLELWHLASRHGRLSARLRASAVELAATDPIWRHRASEF